MRALLRYSGPLLLVGALVTAVLLWRLPVNDYEFHACDPDGLAISTAFLLLGVALATGAAVLAVCDRSASRHRKRVLIALCAAILVVHLARVPELLRERAWSNQTCDVGPMKNPHP